jgi:CMP-N,N'-diacetyllegionaminic acid synthase
MIRGRRVLAVIPARAGSKGLPGKNLRSLGGRPLLGWTIDAARSAVSVDRVVVSTESDEIASVANDLGAEVLRRPDDLATDESSAAAVLRHALLALSDPADLVAYLQPTSPLRTSEDIDACLDLATASGERGVASVKPAADAPEWMFRVGPDGALKRILASAMPLRRQELEPAYLLNGAVYVCPVMNFLDAGVLVDEETAAYVMPVDRSVDIDDESDFAAVKRLVAAPP